MKPTTSELIQIYSATLAKYEAAGDPMAVVQRRLIAQLEREQAAQLKDPK